MPLHYVERRMSKEKRSGSKAGGEGIKKRDLLAISALIPFLPFLHFISLQTSPFFISFRKKMVFLGF